MFVQVISGTVTDLDAFERLGERWEQELRPGATGFLGTTEGVTDDGRFVLVARFESKEAASANSARPEQGEFAAEMQQVTSDVVFHDCSRVVTLFGGGKDTAAFVQVMRGRVRDAAQADDLFAHTADTEKVLGAARPDVVGEVIAIHDDGDGYTDVVYFSSEAEARANEQRELPPEAQARLQQLQSALEIDEYLDLTRLHLR